MKPGRNDPCSCGSGKKYRLCCEGKVASRSPAPAPDELKQLVSMFRAGRYAELESRVRSMLGQYPDSGFAWKLLGASLQAQGKDALQAFQKTAGLMPNDPEVQLNLGLAQKNIGKLGDAEASYRRALKLDPGYAEAHNNLGHLLKDLGQLDGAVASYRRALQINPGFAIAHNNLGTALKDLGQLDDAMASYRRALQINPDYAEAHYNLGIALMDLGQLDGAVASYRRALQVKPDYVKALVNLGTCLKELGQFNDGVACYYRAAEIKPDFAEAHGNIGSVLNEIGQFEGAIASYRRALELKPDFADVYSCLLFLHAYQASLDPLEYLALARGWEQACLPAQDRHAARNREFRRSPLAGRRLRVGYVSGDFRQHAVSYFIEQLFASHDRAKIELFAYSTHGRQDAVTERLRALAEHWVPLAGIQDTAIRERIEADEIDVLIDLSGHTNHNRLGVFARRAAPVQAYYLGYFASTGLTEMDYWIGDEILTPPETDSHFSERVWRLPRVCWSYDGKDAPPSAWRPDTDGTVWLGSFNNLGKLTHETLALWARVLHALPEGKLLLKNKELAEAGNRRRTLDAMAGHGITPDRIELQDSSATPDWSAHMAYYDRLDIALDPVGAMGGVTTTCDALWMAAPVIALQGDRVVSRATASLLNGIGRPEWIARSNEEYISKVVALARDAEQRKALRSGQRSRMASSPLCDARGLAMALENAYIEMFERWFGGNSMTGKNQATT